MQSTVEEFESALKRVSDDSERLEMMLEFSYRNKFIYLDYCRELTEQSLALARGIGDREREALALGNRGMEMMVVSRYDEAYNYLEEAERLLGELPAAKEQGYSRILNALGCIYLEKGRLSEAAVYLRRALNLSESSRDGLLIGMLYSNLAFIQFSLKNYESSFSYSERAIEVLEREGEHVELITILCNYAEALQNMKRFDEAFKQLSRALELEQRVDSSELEGQVRYALGSFYLLTEDYGRAEENLELAFNSESYLKLPYDRVIILLGLGRLYHAKGEMERAVDFLKRALNEGLDNDIAEPLTDIYKELFLLHKEQNSFEEAFFYLEEYNRQKERNFSLELERSIRNVEAESLRTANERIKIISDIGKKITSTLHMESLLDNIYKSVNSLMDASVFGVAGYKRESGKISYDKFMIDGIHAPKFQCSVDDRASLAALVIRENREIFINDLSVDLGRYLDIDKPIVIFDEESEEAERTPQSLLLVPLVLEDRVTGVVTVQSYKKGAYSHLDLDSLKVLASYIAIALKNARQAEMITKKNEELKRLSVTDYLTGVYNRREFELQLRRFWDHSSQESRSVSILLLDADHFKRINDTYGHPTGDECLKRLAALVKENIRDELDCLARYGGEEFIVLLNSNREEALLVAERVRAGVESQVVKSGEVNVTMTVSIGVSTAELASISCEKSSEQLITRADEALYISKSEGRNRVTFLPFT